MNVFVLYLLLLKATMTSFSGLAGLPIVHDDLVVKRHILTDSQMNAAVAVSRAVPGPNGMYVVCAGYYAAGLPGAIAGCLAVVTPAFLVIFLLLWVGRHAENPAVKRAITAVLLAGAGVLVSTTLHIAKTSVTDATSGALVAAAFVVTAFTTIDTFWVMLAAAIIGLSRRLLT